MAYKDYSGTKWEGQTHKGQIIVDIDGDKYTTKGTHGEGLHDHEVKQEIKNVVNQYAQKHLGRNLAANELEDFIEMSGGYDELSSTFRQGGDPDVAFQQVATNIGQTFGTVYKDQMEDVDVKDKDFTGDLKGIFQEMYGRDPDKLEMDEISKDLQSGEYSLLDLKKQIIPGDTEYQDIQHTKSLEEYKGALEPALQQAWQKAQPQVLGAYSKAGMGGLVGGSGLDTAMSKEWTRLQAARQEHLGGLQYGFSQQQAGQQYQGYLNALNQQRQQAGISQQRGWQQQDMRQQRRWGTQDYWRDRQYAESVAGENRAQANKNQWFQLGGSLLGAGGSAAGGYLSR